MKKFPALLLFCFLTLFLSAQQPKKKGKYVEKYDNRHVKLKGRFKDYKKDGAWIWFDKWSKDTIGIAMYSGGVLNGRYYNRSGTIESRGNYLNGNKTGAWIYHSLLRQSDSTCVYASADSNNFEYTVVRRKDRTFTERGKVTDGMRQGLYEAFAGNMEKTGREEKFQEGNYDGNHKNGLWLQYGKNGKLLAQIMYNYDTLKSSRRFKYIDTVLSSATDSILMQWPKKFRTRKITFYSNGQKKREEIYNGWQRDSIWTSWYESGKLRNMRAYMNNDPDGKEEEWFENGTKKMEMNYVKGKRNGLYLWRSSDGSLRDSGMYVDGKKDGSWKEMEGYRKSERMIHCNYKNGKKDGKFTSYFVSSFSGERITEGTKKKKEEGSYSRGRLNGKYTEWYSSGKKKEESNYTDGELRGKRTLYDESGKVIFSKVYTADPPPPTREVIMTQVGDKDVGPEVIVEAPVQEIRDYYDQFSVEKTAEFPGGMEELYKFLGKNIKYPQIEKEMNISGKVYVQFIITDLGKIEKVEVIKGIPGGKGLENEALRVMKMMPDWKPALIKGKPVKQIFRLPVNFQLN